MNSGKLFELFIISLELLLFFIFIHSIFTRRKKNYSKHIAAVSIPRSTHAKHLQLQYHGDFLTCNHYVGSLHGYLFYSIVL